MAKEQVIIGIYGIQGCRKTTLINRLNALAGLDKFKCFDGSQKLAAVTPGKCSIFTSII